MKDERTIESYHREYRRVLDGFKEFFDNLNKDKEIVNYYHLTTTFKTFKSCDSGHVIEDRFNKFYRYRFLKYLLSDINVEDDTLIRPTILTFIERHKITKKLHCHSIIASTIVTNQKLKTLLNKKIKFSKEECYYFKNKEKTELFKISHVNTIQSLRITNPPKDIIHGYMSKKDLMNFQGNFTFLN